MKTLSIKDLSVRTELDRKAMSAVRGGDIADGCVYIPDDNPVDDPFKYLDKYRDMFESLGIKFPF